MSRPERSANHDVEQSAVGNRSELVVSHGDRPGDAHPHAFVLGETKLPGRLADRIGSRSARLKRTEIQDRLDVDETAELAWVRRFACHQLVPGECGGAPGKQRIDRGGETVKRHGEIGGVDFAVLHTFRDIAERLSEPAERRIGGERAEKRLRANELLGGVPDLAGRQEQEAVVLEEGTAPDLAQRLYVLAVVGERGSQFLGARVGELGACAIHHHQKRINLLRKCRIELQFALAPG